MPKFKVGDRVYQKGQRWTGVQTVESVTTDHSTFSEAVWLKGKGRWYYVDELELDPGSRYQKFWIVLRIHENDNQKMWAPKNGQHVDKFVIREDAVCHAEGQSRANPGHLYYVLETLSVTHTEPVVAPTVTEEL